MAEKGLVHSSLIAAIRSSQIDEMIAALNEGADIEEADVHGVSGLPLRTACFIGNTDVARALLERGADINARGGDGSAAPLRLALRCGHLAIAELLLDRGVLVPADVQIPPSLWKTTDHSTLVAHIPPTVDLADHEPSAPEFNSGNDEKPPLEFYTPIKEQPPLVVEETPPTVPEGLPAEPEIEEVDIEACYGTDTNLLGLDLLRMAEETERAAIPPAQEAPATKSIWGSRKKD